MTIARIRSDFPAKFGIPRQAGLVPELRAQVVFEPAFRNADAVRGLDGFSHLWLIWEFSGSLRSQDQAWSPTVRPPRLGGETRLGVFATRSPFRPNPIGLSSVRLRGIESNPQLGPVLQVGGADLMDGTRSTTSSPTWLPMSTPMPASASPVATRTIASGWRSPTTCWHSSHQTNRTLCVACSPRTHARPTRTIPPGVTAYVLPGSTSSSRSPTGYLPSDPSNPSEQFRSGNLPGHQARTRQSQDSRRATGCRTAWLGH